MRYIVLDGNKLARYPEHKVHESWKFSWFNSFKTAKRYADKWLGVYGPFPHNKPNTSYDYSGYGDIIEIRKLQSRKQSYYSNGWRRSSLSLLYST